jgi:hypothetical protein
MKDLGSGERASDELEGNKMELDVYWDKNVDYKLDLNLSLSGLSWPLFIGGQFSRNRSGLIQISLYKMNCNTTSYFDYEYTSISILGLTFID